MNNNMFPPSKKPRLDISYGGSSQIPMPTGHEPPGGGTQAMDLGDDWDDDNLFIEAADEFDKLIALSQAVPTTNVNIIQPTGKQNSEVKPFPTKLSTVHFPDSPKSSKVPYNSGGGSASKFQKSKSFNLDQIATNLENRSDAFRNNNVLSTNGTNTVPESSIKQSDLYKTKCGENEILQKQIKNLTSNLHESKCKLRQAMHDKDRDRNVMKQEMELKIQELRSELDRLNTELMFQKNHITSTEFRTRELKHVRLKEPESPNSPHIGPGAWKRADNLNSSFSRANTSPRGQKSPGECLRSPGRLSVADHGGVRREPGVEIECHYGCALHGIVGERLLEFTRTNDGSSSPSGENSVASVFSSDLVQLITCASFLTSKAKHLIHNILIGCNQMISSELYRLNHLAESEDKGDSTKRDHVLGKSCFSVLPAGQTYDLLHSKKLFSSEESSELRRCIHLLAILCSISAFAVSTLLNVPMSDLVRILRSENQHAPYIETTSHVNRSPEPNQVIQRRHIKHITLDFGDISPEIITLGYYVKPSDWNSQGSYCE
uniref:Uncharacterized protein n=1 Tax=Cacopsylla melanoneura TaxID=428564 RepID=A0A8D8X777_9HEMI